MKDDQNYLYMKFESYKDWNFNETNSTIAVYINYKATPIVDDSECFLMVSNFGSQYIAELVMTEDINITFPCVANFKPNSPIGEVKIQKSYAANKFRNFSFIGAVGSLDYTRFIVDVAPDDGYMMKYDRGSTNRKPILSINPNKISLGSCTIGKTLSGEFELCNDGGGSLDVKITPSSNYIIVSSTQISVDAYDSRKYRSGLIRPH